MFPVGARDFTLGILIIRKDSRGQVIYGEEIEDLNRVEIASTSIMD